MTPPAPKTHRTKMNPVTGAIEVTVLTPVQRALERVLEVVDGQRLKLTNAEGQELVRRVQESLTKMLPGKGEPA